MRQLSSLCVHSLWQRTKVSYASPVRRPKPWGFCQLPCLPYWRLSLLARLPGQLRAGGALPLCRMSYKT
jgi:hypothetical protein